MTRGFRTVALAIFFSGAVTLPGCGGGGGGGGGGNSTPPPTGPTLALNAVQLSFLGTEGGGDPATQALQISNSGLGGSLDWYAKPSSSWLTLDVESGTTPATITVGALVGALPAGGYAGKVYLSSPSAATIAFDVFFNIGGGPSALPGAQWTVMVYMDADNDLEAAALADLNEIEAAPPSPQVNVLALLDRTPGTAAANGRGYTNADGNWSEARRFVVSSDSDPTMIVSPFTSMGELNLGDPTTLQTFLEWGIANFPAAHYAVVIWGHGRGWITAGLDETSGDNLDLAELQGALSGAITNSGIPIFDLVLFDESLSSTIEAATQLSGVALAMAGTEEWIPGDRLLYVVGLTDLGAIPFMGPLELGQGFIRGFVQAHLGGAPSDPSVTGSVVELGPINNAVTAADAFAAALDADMAAQAPIIGRALAEIDGYGRDESDPESPADFVDLASFARVIRDLTGNATVASAADDLMVALRAVVFYHDNGPGHFYSYGLSVYFPSSAADFDASGYATTDFAAATQWDEMIGAYYSEIALDGTAPAVSAPTVSPIATQAAPATLSSNVGGTDVVASRLYAGEVSGSFVTVLFATETGGPTVLVLSNGLEIGDWSSSPTTVSDSWNSRAFAVSDGTDTLIAVAEDRGGWRTVQAVHRSAGLTDDKDVALVFDDAGVFIGCYRDADGDSLRAVALGLGDELDILTVSLDFTIPSAPVKGVVLQGTLTVAASGLELISAPVPNGAYVLGLWAEDFAGNLDADDTPVTVNN